VLADDRPGDGNAAEVEDAGRCPVVVVVDLVPVLVGEVPHGVDRVAAGTQPARCVLPFLDPQLVGIEQDLDLELTAVAAVGLGDREAARRCRS
jgi:hypothetical protein